jgi:hypothetical protein
VPRGKPIADLGRGAVDDGMQLVAFDRDSGCVLTASYLKKVPKLIDFMRAALDAVPPP